MNALRHINRPLHLYDLRQLKHGICLIYAGVHANYFRVGIYFAPCRALVTSTWPRVRNNPGFPITVLLLRDSRDYQKVIASHHEPHGATASSNPNLKRVDGPQSGHHPRFLISHKREILLSTASVRISLRIHKSIDHCLTL
jgi:hypothetical protein